MPHQLRDVDTSRDLRRVHRAMPRDPNGKLYERRLRDPYGEGRERAV
ncbi:hypothetical protein MUU72_33845 [Streptomyces sp. RS10V-4]|nr:hypothetical protein [Streptomyces rhizoryzae]MCK7628014.1 hypothetical protein [Streptomyces rhizoryzae]